MFRTVVPRTCIAFNKVLSSVFKALRELDGENGVWSDEQVVLDGGRRPVWKYCRTSFAVQREGDDQEVCYQDELVSSKMSQTLQKNQILTPSESCCKTTEPGKFFAISLALFSVC
jgi:hypothetical protein